jgi:polygalacturonase
MFDEYKRCRPRATSNPKDSTGSTAASWPVFDVTHFGAVGDGKTASTTAFRKASAACAAAGGCTMRVPGAGIFMTAPFNVTSNMDLVIEAGATVRGISPDVSKPHDAPRLYPIINGAPPNCPSLGGGPQYHSLVYGVDLVNVTIRGGGTIDGNANVWWQWYNFPPGYNNRNATNPASPAFDYGGRGHTLQLVRINGLVIQDITLRRSPSWTVRRFASRLACHFPLQRYRHSHIPSLTLPRPVLSALLDSSASPSAPTCSLSGSMCARATRCTAQAVRPIASSRATRTV